MIPPPGPKCGSARLPNGHIQASARDASYRKQYRYHARWREVRDESKYDRMIAFGEALPALRETSMRICRNRVFRERKVMATVVRLLELTLIRIGNEEYARAKTSRTA